jgi:hypothetical protein
MKATRRLSIESLSLGRYRLLELFRKPVPKIAFPVPRFRFPVGGGGKIVLPIFMRHRVRPGRMRDCSENSRTTEPFGIGIGIGIAIAIAIGFYSVSNCRYR